MNAAELASMMTQSRGYIHYYASDADISNIQGLISHTKQEILTNSLAKLQQRNASIKQQAIDAGIDEASIESLLSGDFLRDLDSGLISNNEISSGEIDVSQAIAKLGEAEKKFDDVANFMNICQEALNRWFGYDASDMVQGYAALIVQEYAMNKKVPTGSIGTQILSDILARSNESFFNMFGSTFNLRKDVVKLIAVIAALPTADFSGPMTIVNKGGNSSSASGADEISVALSNKYNNWINDLNRSIKESAVAFGVLKGNKEVLERMNNFKIDIENVGGKNIDISKFWHPDKGMIKLADEIGVNITSRTKHKVSKSDNAFTFNNGNIDATVGMTVKNSDVKINPKMKKYTIKLQSSSPLFTVLQREGGLGYGSIIELYNLAASHDDTGSLNQDWEKLMDYVKYQVFLDALAGFSPAEYNNYVAIDGNIWTVKDFMTHVATSASEPSIVEAISSKHPSTGGLSRTTYVRRNVWRHGPTPNRMSGYTRSERLRPKISTILYQTKIDIRLTLMDLALIWQSRL